MKFLAAALLIISGALRAQVPPSAAEKGAYIGLHAAAARGDAAQIKRILELARGRGYKERVALLEQAAKR